ncbi:hypothetical protein TVAG_130200 [Trichomonas vaginalis G3]|uniref:Uncharacterized protein n=1 Tax=Trichomonas vaginalis (strain ATCC PRA-98 / G3) TaxID=412133 RepID=A2DIB6_TRIV3|nr:hypothetical protein TVAGG3_0711790 [Trichomonas vaginalis G3]EAY19912.1 hypothetical protein TVAG_130200 [Trichomonas vaginalis G3]KAI5509954.1 hypothetical protein TVAGG3_0711790 [Trichomonas vaginalis G3]|eukprot:XP_001580898.1 hypothetical protein [Trichomonas vaginalis G3]
MIIDNNIHSDFNIETEITTLKPVPTELAKLYNLVDENCNLPFVILCGAKDGTLSTLVFPNTLDVHHDISKPFISKSEPITHIVISRQTLILTGKYGTVNSISVRGQISGSIPFPVEAVSISDPNLLFVSRGHLYSAPLLNPSSFSIVASFPARIVASCSGFCITTSGALIPFEERSPITISPRSELIEFSLSRLREISEENEKLLQQISDVEANLSDSQIIKSINNGSKALEGEITLIPSISPDGRSNLVCQVKLTPIGSYSCQGLSLSLIITTATGFQDIYCLPNIQTININWELPLNITTTTAITIDLVASCRNQAAVVLENIYDIIDLSAEIDLQKVNLGSTFSSLTRNTVQNIFRIGGSIPQALLSPMARQAPTGEKWTLRVDGQNVTVVAGSKSTAMAVRAAVERRAEAKGTFSIEAADETIENLRDQADTILSSTTDEVLPIGGGIKSRVELLHENATKIANEKLMPDV